MAKLYPEDLNALALAAAVGRPFPSSVEDTPESRTVFADLLEENRGLTDNVTIFPATESAPEGKYDNVMNMYGDDEYWRSVGSMSKVEMKSRHKQQIADENLQKSMSLVAKADGERRFTLGPMYVPNQLDAHNEWTDPDELQSALWDYVRSGDRRIRLQHNRDVVAGEWVEAMAIPFPVTVPMVKSDGERTTVDFPANTVFMGVIWEPWAWELIKTGKLRGYSIGGKAERVLVDLEND
jgi:hypothetical protein